MDVAHPHVRTPFDLAAGADGNVWFTSLNSNRVGLVRPAGPIPQTGSVETGRKRGGGAANAISTNVFFALYAQTVPGVAR